jgi:hypothetical protein
MTGRQGLTIGAIKRRVCFGDGGMNEKPSTGQTMTRRDRCTRIITTLSRAGRDRDHIARSERNLVITITSGIGSLGEPCETRDHAAAFIADAGGDESRMEAIGGDPCIKQPASVFAREKNVAKLRAAIGFHGSKTFGQLQIVEIEPDSLMRGCPRSFLTSSPFEGRALRRKMDEGLGDD